MLADDERAVDGDAEADDVLPPRCSSAKYSGLKMDSLVMESTDLKLAFQSEQDRAAEKPEMRVEIGVGMELEMASEGESERESEGEMSSLLPLRHWQIHPAKLAPSLAHSDSDRQADSSGHDSAPGPDGD